MTERITITLPLPDKGLSANARLHWGKKHKLTKMARELAFYTARAAGVQHQQWEKASYTATFYHNINRVRDIDGAIYLLKAYLDGIVQAGLLVNDSGLTYPVVKIVVDKNCEECVVLDFKEIK